MESKEIISFIGLVLIILGIVAVFNAFLNPEIANVLWFCYISLVVVGIGMFSLNSKIILLQINIILIPVLAWDIDFFYRLFTGNELWGITNYLFEGGLNSLGNFLTLQHLYIIPLSLYALYVLRLDFNKAWIGSFFEVILIFFLSLFLTLESQNTNCVFSSCVDFVSLAGIQYHLLWFGGVLISILLVNFTLVRLFRKTK